MRVNVRAGRSRTYIITPRQQFIRGTLEHTCQVRGRREGENVVCQISVDGIPRATSLPDETVWLIVDIGTRLVQVQLIGDVAALWNPTLRGQTVNIQAGRTTRARTIFEKQALLIITLNPDTLMADFYLNDVFIGSQVARVEQWLAPNQSYTIVAMNVREAAGSSGLYTWKEARTSVTLRPSQERTVELRPRREQINTTRGFNDVAVLALINHERIQRGLQLLVIHPALTGMAQTYSNEISVTDVFSNTAPDGSRADARAARAGYPFIRLLELILRVEHVPTSNQFFDYWWDDPEYQPSLLTSEFNEMGVACTTRRNASG